MKKYNLLFALAFVILSSCTKDYDKSIVYQNYATVISQVNEPLMFMTDNGSKLDIVNAPDSIAIPNGERAYIYFSINDKREDVYFAEILKLTKVLTKEIIQLTSSNEEEIGNDEVYLYNATLSGGYLNFNIGFNASGSIEHTVNLINNTLVENPNDGKIYLEFRHNTNGDSYGQTYVQSLSFNVKAYIEANPKAKFVISFKEYGGKTTVREF